jgi:hypothetical protein
MSLIEPKLEELVRKDHPYRKLLSIIDFCEFCEPLRNYIARILAVLVFVISSNNAGFSA